MLATVLLQNSFRNPLELVEGIGLLDMLADPLYVLIILAIAFVVKERLYPNHFHGKVLLRAIGVKLLASFAFACVYVYYYGGYGDTFYYYDGAKAVRDAFWDSPVMGIKVLLAKPGVFKDDTFIYTSEIPTFWRGNKEVVFMCKLTGVLMVFAFQSYWLATFIMAGLSFIGVWKMYRFFVQLYPDLSQLAAVSILFVPSTLFWGSGILKDTVCLSALGWMVYSFYELFIRRENQIRSVIIILISAYFIFNLKAYILYAFTPAIFVWLFLRFRPKSEAIVIKYSLTPILIAAVFGGMGLVMQGIGSSSEKYALTDLEDRAKGFQNYHTRLADEGQSGYSLGEVSFTPTGLVGSFPAAVNVTYFRPYPWEIQDPFQAVSAMESLIFFALFLHTLFSVGVFRTLRIAFTNPDAAFCLVFSLIFGFAVGITAYNFGALVRFKIPGLAFFLMAFWIIRWQAKEERKVIPQTVPQTAKLASA